MAMAMPSTAEQWVWFWFFAGGAAGGWLLLLRASVEFLRPAWDTCLFLYRKRNNHDA